MLKEMCEVEIRTGFIKVKIRTKVVGYFYDHGLNVDKFIAYESKYWGNRDASRR
jgi:hypothetical protein